jgi:hypothetical protein
MELTREVRENLRRALSDENSLDADDRTRILDALDRLADGADLPDDLSDVGDGTTDAEIVAVAHAYYFE